MLKNSVFKRYIYFIFIGLFIAVLQVEGISQEYTIEPEDVLLITVYEQPDLTTRARVTSEGHITFPLIGRVHVADLAPSEVEAKVKELLKKDYLIEPEISVFIEQYHLKQVSVLGSVNMPGKYDMHKEKETTVLEAIAMAGGFSDIASVNGTRIIRNENGEEVTIAIKVTDITKKGLKEKDIPLNPGDIIFVPESFF